MAKTRSISPFFTLRTPFWEEDEWPQVTGTDGLDVYETDSDVVVKAAVPGVNADDVEVTFEDGVLRINAKHHEKDEEKQKKKVVYQSERSRTFNYTTTLPRAIDASKIKAEVENGVVVVKAPLAAEAKPKKIQVTAKK